MGLLLLAYAISRLETKLEQLITFCKTPGIDHSIELNFQVVLSIRLKRQIHVIVLKIA